MRKGKKPNIEIKEKITRLVDEGYSFVEIARLLKFKSRQAVRWHYEYNKKLSTGKAIDK